MALEAATMSHISAAARLTKILEKKCEIKEWESYELGDVSAGLIKDGCKSMKILNNEKRNNGTNNGQDTSDPLETNA